MRGKSQVKIGTNSDKTHPKFGRKYVRGGVGFCLHAEMSVIPFSKPGDTIIVMRWRKDFTLSMARPCPACQHYLREAGIKKVIYSDWDGNFQTYKIK